MTMLQKTLSEKIPIWQDTLKNILNESGSKVISEVTVEQAVKGMRGVKSLICDTSSVSAEKGLIIRGIPLLEMTHILPEEVFFVAEGFDFAFISPSEVVTTFLGPDFRSFKKSNSACLSLGVISSDSDL